MKKSIFGLDENIAAALSCIFTFVSGIIVLILEKENRFVRFHAMQSTLFGLAALILRFVLNLFSSIPLLGWIAAVANWLVGFVTLGVVIYLTYMAIKGQEYKLPVIGETAWQQVNR